MTAALAAAVEALSTNFHNQLEIEFWKSTITIEHLRRRAFN